MHQLRGLLLNGDDDIRVAVADVEHGDASEEVEVFISVRVPDFGSDTFDERQLRRVGRDEIFFL